MATSMIEYFGTLPGKTGLNSPAAFHFSTERAAGGSEPCGWMPANILAQLFGKRTFPLVGGGMPYAAGEWTTTTTGTGAAIADATTGGILLTCGSDSTFNTNLQSKLAWTPVAGKHIVGLAIVQTSDITTVGFEFNLGNSQVDPATSNYTDVIGVKMAVGAGTVLGKVRGDSGTQAASGTLTTLAAATQTFVGFHAVLNATAGSVDGAFFAGADIFSATTTYFTANQQTQAAAILTTPPTMFMNLSAKGSAGNPTVSFNAAMFTIDA
jgi:hypothetical protein